MEFFNSAIEVLQTLVVALGAGLGVWGAINLLEIGAAGNSLDEALKAVRVFGEGFAEVVTGK